MRLKGWKRKKKRMASVLMADASKSCTWMYENLDKKRVGETSTGAKPGEMFLKHQPYGWFKEELRVATSSKKGYAPFTIFLRDQQWSHKNVLRAEQSRRQHQCHHRVSPCKAFDKNLFRMKTCNSFAHFAWQTSKTTRLSLLAQLLLHSFGGFKFTTSLPASKSLESRKCWKESKRAHNLDLSPNQDFFVANEGFVWDPLLKMWESWWWLLLSGGWIQLIIVNDSR